MTGNIRKTIITITIAALILVQVVSNSAAAANSPAPLLAFADANLSAEARLLDSYITDLVQFDKKGADLGKKPSLSRAEFVAYERQGEELKRRLSDVQNALRQIIDKLKAAGQWESLDQIVLAKISDSRFQDFVRREGFKRTLEETASGLSSKGNEIVSPVEKLRNKVQARATGSIFEPGNSSLAFQAVRVAYTTAAPIMFIKPVRCAIAHIRVGVTRPFNGGAPSNGANHAFNCYCLDFDCDPT